MVQNGPIFQYAYPILKFQKDTFFLGHPVLGNLTVTVFVNSTIASTIIEMAVLSSDTLMHSLILQPLPLFLFTYVWDCWECPYLEICSF